MIHVKIQGKLFNILKQFLNGKILDKIESESFVERRGVGVNYLVPLKETEIYSLKLSLTRAEESCQQKLKNKLGPGERQAFHYIVRKIKELRSLIQNQQPLLVN